MKNINIEELKIDGIKNKILKIFYALYSFLGTKEKTDKQNREVINEVKKGKTELNILLHGIVSNYYRAMHSTIKLLKNNGIKVVSVGYDYKDNPEKIAIEIKDKIKKIMKQANVKKFNIMGISRGGFIARYYAEKYGGKKYIKKLVSIYAPVKAVPENEFGYKLNFFLKGGAQYDNKSIEKIKGKFSVKESLFIYGKKDKIINPKYCINNKINKIGINAGGHILISHNPDVMKIVALYLKGEID